MGGNLKTIQLTWHNIFSIVQQDYLKDALNLLKVIEQSLGTGR